MPTSPWTAWRRHFDAHARRPLPTVAGPPLGLDPDRRARLARSLAVFQLGESGEGRIAHEIARCTLPGVDDTYRHALRRFVAEEGRHGRILAGLVTALGGELLRRTWTDGLFARARRLLGVRLKLVVLLAAEVVGITFYGHLAARLPAGDFRAALQQMCADEAHHLAFHGEFFRMQTPGGLQRVVFRATWWAVALAAVATVTLDHRRTLDAMGIPARAVVAAAVDRIRAAESVVLGPGAARGLAG